MIPGLCHLTTNCRIDAEKKQVELTFRSGDLSRSKPSITLSDLEEGQKVEGRVKRVEEYGLFIEIDGSKLSGLCHKSEVRGSLFFVVRTSLY